MTRCRDEQLDDDLSPLLKKLIADGALVEVEAPAGVRRRFVPVSQERVVASIREHREKKTGP